jgi:hypothetical protein
VARNPRTGRRDPDDTLRDQYPVLFAFGGGPIAPLSHAEAIAATPQDRIRSVWPFLVRSVLRFAETLRPRDRANFDPEDVIVELYLTLLEKDDKWIPDRGMYLTFAGTVVENELHAIRDRAHTVHSPRNSSCRLKQYESAAEAGALSARKERTYSAIRRVATEPEPLPADAAHAAPDTLDLVARRDHLRQVKGAVAAGVMALAPDEAACVGGAYGLWGRPEQPLALIAFKQRMSIDEVKKVKRRAQEKIRARLEALKHPLVPAG